MNKLSRSIILLLYAIILVGLMTQRGVLLAIAIPFILYLAVSLFYEPGEPQLRVQRTLSADRVNQYVPVIVHLNITNEGTAIETLLIEDVIPTGLQILEGSPRMITSMKPGEIIKLTYTLHGPRGYYRLPGVRVTASDHLGLIQKHKDLAHPSRFLILPNSRKLPEIVIRPNRTLVHPGLIPARKGGPGVEFYGVREYQPGDPVRWINERATARHDQRVFINEFEQERAVDIGLLLDCRVETNLFQHHAELLEHSTQATATLAESFLNYGNRVGLLIYGGVRNWVQPGYGKIQRERIFQALAGVHLYDSHASQELANLPTRLFPSRSQLVLISSLLAEDLPTLLALRANGYPLLVISPDPIAFESKLLGSPPDLSQAIRIARLEREHLFQQLRRTGTRIIEWQVDQPFEQVARSALSRNFGRLRERLGWFMRRFMILATILASLGIGIPYALDGKWAAFVIGLLAAALWVFPSPHWIQRPTISFITLAMLGIAGTLFDYTPLWQFTSFVLLLIAWDLEHFTRLLQPFANDPALETKTHTYAHLKRLGFVAGVGWLLGTFALSIQLSTSFSGVLILCLIVFLSLKAIVRLTGSIKLEG